MWSGHRHETPAPGRRVERTGDVIGRAVDQVLAVIGGPRRSGAKAQTAVEVYDSLLTAREKRRLEPMRPFSVWPAGIEHVSSEEEHLDARARRALSLIEAGGATLGAESGVDRKGGEPASVSRRGLQKAEEPLRGQGSGLCARSARLVERLSVCRTRIGGSDERSDALDRDRLLSRRSSIWRRLSASRTRASFRKIEVARIPRTWSR